MSGSAIISVVGWPTDVIKLEDSILILNIGLAKQKVDILVIIMWNGVVEVATNRDLSLCPILQMLVLHRYKLLYQRPVMSR